MVVTIHTTCTDQQGNGFQDSGPHPRSKVNVLAAHQTLWSWPIDQEGSSTVYHIPCTRVLCVMAKYVPNHYQKDTSWTNDARANIQSGASCLANVFTNDFDLGIHGKILTWERSHISFNHRLIIINLDRTLYGS